MAPTQPNFKAGPGFEWELDPQDNQVSAVKLVRSLDVPVSALKAADYTLGDSDYFVRFSATAAARAATLPTAVGKAGRLYTVINTTGTNAVTVGTTSAQTINGGATDVLTNQWDVGRYISDGANWMKV